MKTERKRRSAGGFTLVELLIVIIIIGILAGALLLITGAGSDKAEATRIVSDLRSLKSAAMMYHADNPDATAPLITSLTPGGGNANAILGKYMDRTISGDCYFSSGMSGGWYVFMLPVNPCLRRRKRFSSGRESRRNLRSRPRRRGYLEWRRLRERPTSSSRSRTSSSA